MKPSTVSLIVTCYNKAPHLAKMLDSVLAQTYKHMEIVVVDDGSTDDSANILESYRDAFAARGFDFRIIRQKNQGPSKATGEGLKAASGTYICFCDADDLLDKQYAMLPAAYLDKNMEMQYVLFGVDALTREKDFRAIDDTFTLSLRTYGLSAFCSGVYRMMVRKNLIHKISLPALLRYDIQCQEPQVWIPLIAGGYPYGHINRLLYHYRVDASESICKVTNREEFFHSVKPVLFDLLRENGMASDANFRMAEYKVLLFLHVQYPEAASERIIENLLADGFYFDVEAAREIFVSYRVLMNTILQMLYGVRQRIAVKPFKRVIGYGVLGDRGKTYLDLLVRVFAKPDKLWDEKGDGGLVDRPDFSKLEEDDLVVVFPANLDLDFAPAGMADAMDLLADSYVQKIFEI